MASDDDMDDAELLKHISELYHQGIKLTPPQIWILRKCYQRHRTIKSLAEEKNVSRQAIHVQMKFLEAKNLVEEDFKSGSGYWRCNFDITETADYTFKVRYQKRQRNFEQIIGYLSLAQPIVRTPDIAAQALSYLYRRSVRRFENGEEGIKPAPQAVRAFLMGLVGELEEFALLLRTIANMPIYEETKVHDVMGEMKENQQIISDLSDRFIKSWDQKFYTSTGVKWDADLNTLAEHFYKEFRPNMNWLWRDS